MHSHTECIVHSERSYFSGHCRKCTLILFSSIFADTHSTSTNININKNNNKNRTHWNLLHATSKSRPPFIFSLHIYIIYLYNIRSLYSLLSSIIYGCIFYEYGPFYCTVHNVPHIVRSFLCHKNWERPTATTQWRWRCRHQCK